MRAKTFAEHRIRARAAVQYPGWRVDFVGPATAVMTNIMGHRRMVTFRQRRRRRDGPIMDCIGGYLAAGDVDGIYRGHGGGHGRETVRGDEDNTETSY